MTKRTLTDEELQALFDEAMKRPLSDEEIDALIDGARAAGLLVATGSSRADCNLKFNRAVQAEINRKKKRERRFCEDLLQGYFLSLRPNKSHRQRGPR